MRGRASPRHSDTTNFLLQELSPTSHIEFPQEQSLGGAFDLVLGQGASAPRSTPSLGGPCLTVSLSSAGSAARPRPGVVTDDNKY